MTRVATLAQSRFALFSTLQTQQRLFEAQREVSTGVKSQDFAGISRDASRLVSVKNELARVEQFQDNIAVADRRLQMMSFTINGVEEVARDFRTTLLNAKNGATADVTEVPALAQGLLDQIVDLLNVRDDSRHLFAGGAIETRPVQLDNGVYTPPVVPPFPAAANFDYYEGDDVVQQARIDQDFVVDYGVTAREPAFEKVIRAFDAISELDFSNPISDAERQVVDDAVGLLNAALDIDPAGDPTLKELFSQTELDRKLIDDVSKKHENFIQFAQTTIADIEQVNTAEAVANLNFEQVVLEASFASLARIQQVSLSAFLV